MFCRKCGKTIDDESSFCRFCGTEVAPVVQETSIELEYRQNSELYDKARALMSNGSFEEARRILLDLSGFRNADELAERCITGAIEYRRRTTYEHAVGVFKNEEATKSDLLQAAEDLEALGEYENAEELAEQCRSKVKEVLERTYRNACELMNGAKTFAEMISACEELEKIGSYKDSFELAQKGRSQLDKYKNYDYAVKCFNEASTVHQYMDVIEAFRTMGGFLDSEEMCCKAVEKIYSEADKAASKDTTDKLNYAAATFEAIKTYKDAEQRASECRRRSDEIIAERKEKARREAEEADELEFQYCKKILSKPDAQIAEIEEAEGRLYLIKEHEGAEAAIEECKQRHESLQKKGKRNTVIGIIVVSAIAVLIVLSLIFVNAILPAIKYSNAQSLAEQGRYSEAAEEYSNLKEYKDSREMAAKMRAQSCVEQGKIDEAASLLYSANLYDLANECLKTEFNRLVSEGKNDEAIAFADRHYELETNKVELCKDMIDELLNQGKYDEAIAFCKKNHPDTDELYRCFYQKAEDYELKEKWSDAAETYNLAKNYLDAKDKTKECYAKYADKCRSEERYDDAIKYYTKANKTDKVQECYIKLGQKAYDSGDYSTALANYQKAGLSGSSYRSELKEELYTRGLLMCYSGEYSEAVKCLKLSEKSQSNELIKCCNIIIDMYNGDSSLSESYNKLCDVHHAHIKDKDSDVLALANSLMGLDAFSSGSSFRFWTGPTVYCYVTTFTWDNGDVKTYCISEYMKRIGVEYVYGYCNSSREVDELARKCFSTAVSSDLYMYYDPDKGYYINDNGIRVYFHKSGSDLIVENHGTSVWAGLYNEYTFVLPYGL